MENKKIVRKWWWVWEFEKEEQWLNTMALSGWVLSHVSPFSYHFVPCEPGEYTLRLEKHEKDEAYLSFMQETGAEHVGSLFGWVYFRKKTTDGLFDLFSDLDSKISHLNKIIKPLRAVCFANLLIGLSNSFGAAPSLGCINLLCAALLSYALGRIQGKKDALEEKRILQE